MYFNNLYLIDIKYFLVTNVSKFHTISLKVNEFHNIIYINRIIPTKLIKKKLQTFTKIIINPF